MKHIKTKLLVGILVPLVAIFCCFGVLITSYVGNKFRSLTWETVENKSVSVSYQISEFFTKYMEIVNQMGENEAILQMMRDMHQPGDALLVESYEMAENCLNNIEEYDANISLAWTVDLDSGDSVRSGYITRGLTIDEYDVTTRSWYLQAMEAQALVITEPYIDTLSQTLVTTVIQPVYDRDSSIVGLVAIDMTLDTLGTTLDSYQLGKEGKFFLVTDNDTIMYHPDSDKVTANISEGSFSEELVHAISNKQNGRVTYEYNGVVHCGYISEVGTTGWRIISGLPESEFEEDTHMLLFQVVFLFVLVGVVLTVLILLVATGIVRPIKRLAAFADQIADGHLDIQIDTHAKDETALVANALARTVHRLKDYIAYINEITYVLDELAKGNLNLSLEQAYDGEFRKIKTALEHFVEELKELMYQINDASHQVSEGSKQMASGAQFLADGTVNQTMNISNLSTEIREMVEQMKKSAEVAREASQNSGEETVKLAASRDKTEQLMEAIQEINSKSDQIGAIIQTMDDMAEQTNILAINAMIEAARAGSAGKSFAVVANEVATLANKSAEASQGIADLIEETLHAVTKCVSLAGETEQLQNVVEEKARQTDTLMQDIVRSTTEEVKRSESITSELEEISAVVQHTSATAEESSAASQQLREQAEVLKDMVSKFKLN